MVQAFGKPFRDNDGNEISYKALLHHLPRFGCYTSQLIPKPQRHGKFGPSSKQFIMVGYVHDSTTLWLIWDLAFHIVGSQSNVILKEERNTHTSYLPRDHTYIFELPEETEYIEEIDSGDGLLQAYDNETGTQDNETGGDGLLHDHAGNSRTGEGHRSGDHDCADNDTVHNLPDADNRRTLPASLGVRSSHPDKEDAPLLSRETVIHNRHLHRKNDKARQTPAMTKQSCQPPPCTNRITRNHVQFSVNALIIMAKALTPTSINSDPFTYAESMDSPQHQH